MNKFSFYILLHKLEALEKKIDIVLAGQDLIGNGLSNIYSSVNLLEAEVFALSGEVAQLHATESLECDEMD